MKKRILLIGLLISVFTFGCSVAPEPLQEKEEIVDVVEEENGSTEETASDKENADASEIDEKEGTDVEIDAEKEAEENKLSQENEALVAPPDQVLQDMFRCLNTYCGLIFIEDQMSSFYTLTNEEVFVMTGLACATVNYEAAESVDNETGYPVFSVETFKEMQKDLFADRFKDAYEECTGNMFVFKTDKGVSTLVGDWGMLQPRCDIVSVVQKDDAFVVTTDYYAFDMEAQEKMEDYCTATATYTIIPSDTSAFGYVISDMSFEVAE